MPRITDLYREAFDFPMWNGEPIITYMIAAVPRSGSTFLATTLWQTGLLGAPMEYLNYNNQWMCLALERMDALTYWGDIIRRRTSPNGTFGFKMFVRNYHDLASRNPEVLPLLTPRRVIRLVRANKVAQAVSYYKAMKTQAWFADVPAGDPPPYSFLEIKKCAEMIDAQEAGWSQIFKLTEADTFDVSYERLVANPTAEAKLICGAMEIEYDAAHSVIVAAPTVQADNYSKDYIERYEADLKHRDG